MTLFTTADSGAHWHPAVEIGGATAPGMYSCLEDLSQLAVARSGTPREASGNVGILWETSSVGGRNDGSKSTCVGPGCAIVLSRLSLP